MRQSETKDTGTPTIKVWDPLVRVSHWLGVALVTTAWLTHHGPPAVHDGAGYALLALIAVRIVWGVIGPRKARFAGFLRSPRKTWRYARAIFGGRERRYLGHNPLGGWMILALLLALATACISGWLYTTEAYWGVAWVERVHRASAVSVLVLAAIHVAGVVFTSIRQRENLAAAMVHGRKAVATGMSPERSASAEDDD